MGWGTAGEFSCAFVHERCALRRSKDVTGSAIGCTRTAIHGLTFHNSGFGR